MMLQGHFVSSLLNNTYKDHSNTYYVIWEYFRGITAPTFFTITGFIFMYLVLNQADYSKQELRINKGIKRGVTLLLWGYILRMGVTGILSGYVHEAYFYTDVLHIIGLSLIILCLLFKLLYKKSTLLFNTTLVSFTIILFLFERYYNAIELPYLPTFLTHYFTKANGAVFSIFPWFGYVSFGAFLSSLFLKHQENKSFYFLLPKYLGIAGLTLLFFSTAILLELGNLTQHKVFTASGNYNYLFSRLGNVLILMSLFVYFKNVLNSSLFIKIGKVTLSIYIVHHVILYGSWFNTGLCRWYYNSLTLNQALIGAIVFIMVVCFLVLQFRTHVNLLGNYMYNSIIRSFRIAKVTYLKSTR